MEGTLGEKRGEERVVRKEGDDRGNDGEEGQRQQGGQRRGGRCEGR